MEIFTVSLVSDHIPQKINLKSKKKYVEIMIIAM